MIESFLNYLQFEKRVSKHTVTSYKTDLTQFAAFLRTTYSESNPAEATYAMIRSWIAALAADENNPRTTNRKIACLRSFYRFLLKQELVTTDPMAKIRVLKTARRLPHFVKETEMVNLLDGEDHFTDDHAGLRDQLMVELFYGTGMRLSELINLKESDVNLRERTIRVLGKRNKERVVPFGVQLVKQIESYLAEKRKVITANSEVLFVTDQGKKLYPVLVYRIVKKLLKAHTAADKKSPHVLRHTFATHLLDKGAEINAVKDLLGHSSLAATQVYTHNSMEKLRKVFEQAHPKA